MKLAPEPDLKGLRAMPSLGKASAELLLEVGILNPDQLVKVGAKEAWRRLRFAHGKRVTITWIYALEIAIQGISWKELSAARARKLRAAAEAIIAELGPAGPPTKRSPKPIKRV
jgi:DNA transformation protein